MSSGWRFHRKPFVNLIKGGFTHFESGWLPYRRNTWQENLVFEYQLTCIEPKMYFANFFVCSEKQWHLPTPPLQKNFHTKSRDHYVHHKVSGSHPARREMIPGLAWPSNTKQVVCKIKVFYVLETHHGGHLLETCGSWWCPSKISPIMFFWQKYLHEEAKSQEQRWEAVEHWSWFPITHFCQKVVASVSSCLSSYRLWRTHFAS